MNDKKKHFFIHIQKCGGMTIRHSNLLKNRVQIATKETHISPKYTNDLLKAMNAIGDHHGNEHARYRDINPKFYDTHTFFAIVRNPWARVVSRYFFAKKVIEVEKKEPRGKHPIGSFEDFLEDRHKWAGKLFMWHRAIRGWYPAKEHVIDHDGVVKCDIMRFEHYEEDICRYFDLKEMTGPRNVTGIHKGTYQELYTPKTIQIIADWYKDDIDQWGFDFDTGATKNFYFENK